MKLNANITTLSIAALVVSVLAYWFFFTGTGNEAPLAPTAVGESQTRFQSLVAQLQPIRFPTELFSDPRFTALIDLSTPIIEESVGRTDPFSPIPGVTGQ